MPAASFLKEVSEVEQQPSGLRSPNAEEVEIRSKGRSDQGHNYRPIFDCAVHYEKYSGGVPLDRSGGLIGLGPFPQYNPGYIWGPDPLPGPGLFIS